MNMKKIRFFLMLAFVGLLAVGCKDDPQQVSKLHSLKVGSPEFSVEGSKIHLLLNDGEAYSKLGYDDGDKITVNGKVYTLHYGEPYWTATPDGEEAEASQFYCFYGRESNISNYSEEDNSVLFNLDNTFSNGVSNSNGILLGGSTNNDVVTLHPACCILRFVGTGITSVKVGFSDNVVPRKARFNSEGRIVEVFKRFLGVTTDGGGQFLQMIQGTDNDWYVAVPVEGDRMNTYVYLEWVKNGSTVRRKTTAAVTLRKGYVYTLGEGPVSPWTDQGASKATFKVSRMSTGTVRFSAGNLQFKPYDIDAQDYNIFQFARHQYDVLGSINEQIDIDAQIFLDLMAWGTSGWDGGSAEFVDPGTPDDDPLLYGPGNNNLTGRNANADWGVYNEDNIYYYSNKNTGKWRTLTKDEWNYLLFDNSRSGKWGLGRVETAEGLVILPNVWELPDGLSFTSGAASGYNTNVYTVDTWDKMEKAGAIFLPVGGYRTAFDVFGIGSGEHEGYYWSTTYEDEYSAWALKISATGVELTPVDRHVGCSVRLVKKFEQPRG